jgi:hypothetical protein
MVIIGGSMHKYKGVKKVLNVYALYKGNEYICDGTAYQIADKTGLKIQTIRHYNTQAYRDRVSEQGKRLVKIGRELVYDNDNY